jgi:glycine/D-amino acid oxidase-like deaminating enzyme/nitrite reductase/ring-hydroxylating ferredoxin subunit
LWLDGWARPASDPLADGDRFDALVVGAGLTGLATGLLLARAGRRVGVVEARHAGAVTTGHSTAKVSLLQGTMLSRLSRLQPRDVVAAYLDANREGLAWLERFCADHAVPVERRDAVTYAASPAELGAVRREHDTARDLGLAVGWHESLDTPFPLHGAALLADQLQLDPTDLLGALAAELRAHGGTLHQGTRVVSVSKTGEPVVRLADGRSLHTDHLVLATGTPILDRGLHFAKLEPKRSYLLAFTGATPPDRMYLSAGRSARSVRDAPPGRLLVGGAGHPVGRTGPTTRRLAELRRWTAQYFPGARETHAWSAQDYASYAGHPLVDALPGSNGRILVATGFDKWGFTNGVAAALAVAGRVLDGATAGFGGGEAGPRPLARALGINTGVGVAQGRNLLRSVLHPPVHTTEVDGRTCRLLTVCTHLGGVLRWNDAERSWDCPLHGSRFAADGQVLEGPATRPLRHL